MLSGDAKDAVSLSDISGQMDEYVSIMSDPELEWTTNTLQAIDAVKQRINVRFHAIYIQCMAKMSKTSLNPVSINEMIRMNANERRKGHAEPQWEQITNCFIEFLSLTTRKFEELAEQHSEHQTAETAQDTINKLVLSYKLNKHQLDELEAVLEKEREYRSGIKKDMSFNIGKLENDIAALKEQYEGEEKALADHELDTKKQQSESHERTVKELNTDIEKTNAQLIAKKAANAEQEIEVKKRVKRMDNEIEEIRNKYDADMISISVESEKLLKLHESETNRLNEPEIKIRKLKEMREAHEKLLQEQREREEQLRVMCEEAATRIQKIWRGYSCRKNLSSKKKKGEGKGKGKKKKNN